jgi:hypothetical protein
MFIEPDGCIRSIDHLLGRANGLRATNASLLKRSGSSSKGTPSVLAMAICSIMLVDGDDDRGPVRLHQQLDQCFGAFG